MNELIRNLIRKTAVLFLFRFSADILRTAFAGGFAAGKKYLSAEQARLPLLKKAETDRAG